MAAAGAKSEGGVQILSVRVRKTIQSIKEVVGNHSDAEIYAALKECNMDPDETTQTLINQDPFHEVKRKKDKKRENTGGGCRNFTGANRNNGHAGPGMKVNTYLDRNNQKGYTENTSAGASKEFRAVKDKIAYPKFSGESKPLLPNASSTHVTLGVAEKSLVGNLNNQKLLGGNFPFQTQVSTSAPIATLPKETSSTVITGKELPKENRVAIQESVARVEIEKPSESSLKPINHVSNNYEVGVHSDPVHVPSSESCVSSNVGDIKRDAGIIDVQSQLSENYDKLSAIQDISVAHSLSASTDTTEGILKTVDKEMDQLQDKPKEVDTKEKSNVIFADHIRVVESNSSQLIFGSFGQNIEFSSVSISDSKNVESPEEKAFTEVMDHPLPSISSSPEEEEVSNAREIPAGKNIDDLHHEPDNEPIRLISHGFGAINPQDSSNNLSTFSAYYGYSIPYHRPTVGDNILSQGLQSHQEALSSSSSMIMQQQPLLAQMYPQVHLSHYGNLMPIHQFLSPAYVPPTMTISGFSNNPTSYPPPQTSNGNISYRLMPGGSSSQQLAVSATNPIADFGNYAINSAGGAGSASTGLDDLNHFVSNPQQQGEGSEMWIQNTRQLIGMQQPYFYNMAGQSAHGNYLQLHGHPSLTQQFPGVLPSQPTASANHHHVVQFPGVIPSQPTTANQHHLVGNTAATPGAQMGGYQQPFYRM